MTYVSRVLIVGVLAAAMLFAGCTTDSGPKGQPNVPVFGDDTGAILGQVLNDEDIPIVGAEVGILELGLVAKTDESGIFTLNNVVPGPHTVAVSAVGYEPFMRTVTVLAGQATDLIEMRLVQLPSNEPYSRVLIFNAQLSGLMWKLTPTCVYATDYVPQTGNSLVDQVRTLAKSCGGVRLGNQENPLGGNITAGCNVCEMHTAMPDFVGFTGEWQTIVGQLDWRQQSGATGKGFLLDINAPNITRGNGGSINQADPYTWHWADDEAPITIRVDKDGLAARGVKESDWNNPPNEQCWGDFDDDPDDEELSRNNCSWFYRVFPAACDAGICEDGFGPDYGVMLENTATIYFSYFIRMEAPEDYTAVQSQ